MGMERVASPFKTTKAKVMLCILGWCFSGGGTKKGLEDSPIPKTPGVPFDALIGEGRVLLTASKTDEVAYELPQIRHGILTKALLDVLLSATSDVNILSIASEIMQRVQAEAARMGVVQTPVLLGSVTGALL